MTTGAIEGTGMLADRLWEIEGGDGRAMLRQARRLGLSWVLARLAAGERERVPEPARARLAESIRQLRVSGIAVWGVSGISSRDEEAADSRALRCARDFELDGWCFEPVPTVGAEQLAARIDALSAALPRLGLGVMVEAGAAPALGRALDPLIGPVHSPGPKPARDTSAITAIAQACAVCTQPRKRCWPGSTL